MNPYVYHVWFLAGVGLNGIETFVGVHISDCWCVVMFFFHVRLKFICLLDFRKRKRQCSFSNESSALARSEDSTIIIFLCVMK
jgi:hypothetical protein